MPFIVALSPTYKYPVKFTTPDENGDAQDHDFIAVFKRCTVDEATALAGGTAIELIREVLVGWDGVYASKDELLPFGAESVTRMLGIPQAVSGLVAAFWASYRDAGAKN